MKLIYLLTVTVITQFALHGVDYFLRRIDYVYRLIITAIIIALAFGSIIFWWKNITPRELITLIVINFILSTTGAVVLGIYKARKLK